MVPKQLTDAVVDRIGAITALIETDVGDWVIASRPCFILGGP